MTTDAGSFDLDALEAEATGEPFRFTYAGQQWNLKPFDMLDKGLLRRLNSETPDALAIELLREGLDDQWPAFDAVPMPLRTLNALIQRWAEAAGLSLGEGVASASS